MSDEEISVDHIIQKRQKEQKKIIELEYINKVLKEENLELKSDVSFNRKKLFLRLKTQIRCNNEILSDFKFFC